VDWGGTFDGNAQGEYAPVRGQDPEIVEEQENARRAGVEMKRYYRNGDVQKCLFVLQDSEDVRLEGVAIRNAPLWNVRLQDCNRVWIRGIHLHSDLERGVNSDFFRRSTGSLSATWRLTGIGRRRSPSGVVRWSFAMSPILYCRTFRGKPGNRRGLSPQS